MNKRSNLRLFLYSIYPPTQKCKYLNIDQKLTHFFRFQPLNFFDIPNDVLKQISTEMAKIVFICKTFLKIEFHQMNVFLSSAVSNC